MAEGKTMSLTPGGHSPHHGNQPQDQKTRSKVSGGVKMYRAGGRKDGEKEGEDNTNCSLVFYDLKSLYFVV